MIEIIPNWHPVWVHFTVALTSIAIIFYWSSLTVKISKFTKEPLIIARWLLWLGSLITVITVIAGFIAYNTVKHDAVSHLVMNKHRNLAIITLVTLMIVSIWSVIKYIQQKPPGKLFLIGLLFILMLLWSTAWHGAELVYRYGIGVKSLPKTINHQHHQH